MWPFRGHPQAKGETLDALERRMFARVCEIVHEEVGDLIDEGRVVMEERDFGTGPTEEGIPASIQLTPSRPGATKV